MNFETQLSSNSLVAFLVLFSLSVFAFVFTRLTISKKAYRNRLKRVENGSVSFPNRKPIRKSFWNTIWRSRNSDSLEARLRELEVQQKQRRAGHKSPTLITRLRQAGLRWSLFAYALISLACSIVFFITFVLWGFNLIPAIGFGLSLGLFSPHIYIKFLLKRRMKKFGREFSNALDILVRGLRSGLPMVDCLRIAAKDTQEPVRSEFQKVIDDQALGTPTHEALIKMAERVPLTDVNFFAIVVKIQNRTGGSLSEALNTLSNTLRERRKLEGKVNAMSQEAKTSAGIIGSLPFFVAAALFFLNPEYLLLIIQDTSGIFVLIGSGLWMMIGIAVMRKMIDFEI